MPANLIKYLILIISILLFITCKNEIDLSENITTNSLLDTYDIFWEKMNTNYLYWDIEKTDWDQVNAKYRPKFTVLNSENIKHIEKAITYFEKITENLIDGHFLLFMKFDSTTITSFHPAWEKKLKTENFHEKYPYQNIVIKYLDKNFYRGIDKSNIIDNKSTTTICGTVNNNILYFSTNQFSLLKSYSSKSPNSVRNSLNFFFNQIKNNTENLNGLIIDVRGSMGGNLSDLNFFIGHLINKPLHFGYTQYKNNIGRIDYTPWIKAYINPQANSKKIDIPIIVLADNHSASLSEFVVFAIKALPNGIFIGEKTWGATGAIVDEHLYDSGQFKVNDCLFVKTSSIRFKYLDEKIYEGKGISPDIEIPFNLKDLNNNVDKTLELAIELIKNKKYNQSIYPEN